MRPQLSERVATGGYYLIICGVLKPGETGGRIKMLQKQITKLF